MPDLIPWGALPMLSGYVALTVAYFAARKWRDG